MTPLADSGVGKIAFHAVVALCVMPKKPFDTGRLPLQARLYRTRLVNMVSLQDTEVEAAHYRPSRQSTFCVNQSRTMPSPSQFYFGTYGPRVRPWNMQTA